MTAAGDSERAAALEALRVAQSSLFASQRRLRGRDVRIDDAVSFAHYPLLQALADSGELPAGQLPAQTSPAPATVTQMLEALAAAGIVERSRSDRDRRIVTARLTAEGTRRYERKRAELGEKWRAALADLDATELEAAARVVSRLAAYLDEL